MGLTDFYALAREVDPGWLALTVEGGYLWSLVAWTLVAFAAGAAAGWFLSRLRHREGPKAEEPVPERVERRKLAADKERREMIRGFSRAKARAVLLAFETDGMADVGDHELEVIGSIQAHEGVFVMEAMSLYGVTRTGTRYSITDAWRAWLKSPRNLRLVEWAACRAES